jgi:hypothetical protein
MFAGHIGAALAIGRAERRVNVGVFILAAMALDAVLWILVLLGRESVIIPADYARTHLAVFRFPYSHGLVAGAAWSILAGAAVALFMPRLAGARWRLALLIAAAVFSHWLLDALVHAAELPLAGSGSSMVGLGLWRQMPLALGVEAAIAVAGLWVYLHGSGLSHGARVGLAALVLVLLAFTVVGMTVAPAPPSVLAMAASSLAPIAVVTALAAWIVRTRG